MTDVPGFAPCPGTGTPIVGRGGSGFATCPECDRCWPDGFFHEIPPHNVTVLVDWMRCQACSKSYTVRAGTSPQPVLCHSCQADPATVRTLFTRIDDALSGACLLASRQEDQIRELRWSIEALKTAMAFRRSDIPQGEREQAPESDAQAAPRQRR